MRITSKGQVTIPIAIRHKAGLLPDTEVGFSMDGDRAILGKVRAVARRGTRLVGTMRGTATMRRSTDEIMALTRSGWWRAAHGARRPRNGVGRVRPRLGASNAIPKRARDH